MAAKQYRLQRSDHLGVVNRGFGYGRTASWSAWRTIRKLPNINLTTPYMVRERETGRFLEGPSK